MGGVHEGVRECEGQDEDVQGRAVDGRLTTGWGHVRIESVLV